MSISRLMPAMRRTGLRARALEAIGLALVLGFLPQLAFARSATALALHPGWLAVLVLAARYGRGGWFAGLAALGAAVGAAAAITGAGLSPLRDAVRSGPDLLALAGTLLVSWIASWHLRRQAALDRRLHSLIRRNREARAAIAAMRGAVATLRARVERTSSSLTFMRDVAVRLEGRDPIAAAEAAADLALARTGAAAVAVRVGPRGHQRLLAIRDARRPHTLQPLEARTADLSVPLRDGDTCIGLLSLWGVSRSDRDETTRHELAVIATWCAAALRPLSGLGAGRRPRVGVS